MSAAEAAARRRLRGLHAECGRASDPGELAGLRERIRRTELALQAIRQYLNARPPPGP